MNSFKQQVLDLRKKDLSLPEIVRLTGKGKSTVYYHIKNLPLSKERMQKVREEHSKRIRVYPLSRKGKSTRVFRQFNTWSPDLVSLVGHLLFDGEITAHSCVYHNRSAPLIRKVEALMEILYAYPPSIYTNAQTGVRRISYHNVALSSYLKRKSFEILNDVTSLPLESKRAFVRAFFDDEGCMDFRPAENRRMIRGYQKDTRILFLVRKLLEEFDVSSRVKGPNEIIVVGKENLKKFEREINFSPGVRINGNRTNSRWKKHVEKRELLRRAIASFKN